MEYQEISKEINENKDKIENPKLKNEIKLNNNESLKNNINIDYNNDILKEIFHTSKEDNSKFIPFLLKNGKESIKKIFIREDLETSDLEALKDYINKKIQLINQIIEIVGNSYEIIYIIFDYLEQQKISPFIFFIDLYIDYLENNNDKIPDENKQIIIKEIKNIFSYFISCGLLTKNITDYIFQKIALFQLEKKFNIKIFNDILPLIEIIYGKYYNDSIVHNFIAKKYIYFYEKEASIIKTNISQKNNIFIKEGFCLILWFYLNNYEESPKCSICEMKMNNTEEIKFIISDNYDIEIQFNDSITIKEKENKTFKLKPKIWAQLKIEFSTNEISLYLFQDRKKSDIKIYEKKNYIILNDEESCKKKENDKLNYIENFKFENSNITDISFFKNYLGIIGSVIFFNKLSVNDKNMNPIDSLYGLENKKINEFLRDKKLFSGFYFFLAPSLYLPDQNKIIDSENNVNAELPIRACQLNQNLLNLNSILVFHNYINNIFYLGGCNNFLPLFEIFYKFTLEEKDTNLLKDIFNKLFNLLEVIFIDRKKNALLPLKKENSFFETLQLFMEKIDSVYYFDNENLLQILLNIANYYNLLKKKKITELKENSGFFTNILFNPLIIMKFNLSLQQKLLKQIINYSLLIPFSSINKLLLLISQKYSNDEIEKNGYSKSLFDYIYKIFESTNVEDQQRESLFLLYKNKINIYSSTISLSDNIFIHIMETFIIYLDLGVKNKKYNETGIKRRKNTIIYLLNSNNNFIETLLNYLSETNIHVKKVIINFLRILTQTYGDMLDQYFLKQKKNKKNKNRIGKDEFYDFIKENIAPNYSNEDIEEDEITKNIKYKKNAKDASIFDLDDEKSDNEKEYPKIGKKRSNSIDNNEKLEKDGKLEKFKKFLKYEKSEKNKRKISFSKKRKRNSLINENNLGLNNKILSKEKEEEKKDINKEFKESEIKEEKKLNKNNLIKKSSLKNLTEEEKIVIQNTKFEISLVLYNWLVSLITEKEEEKVKSNDNTKEESIQNVIDFIVKFISYSKELEVIYRTLLLIWDQKDRIGNGQKNDNSNIYYNLLKYISDNSLFIQLLIELLINSFIYKNVEKDKKEDNDLFIIISKSKEDSSKMKEKYINLIYDHSKELLIDIYFDKRNLKKNNVIIQMFCVILRISRGLEENVDEYKRFLLFKFLKEFFMEICENYNKKKDFKISDYIIFLSLFVENSFLLKTADKYIKNEYSEIKDRYTFCLPDFLIDGIVYETKVTEWTGFDIYKSIYKNIKQIFHIEKIFKQLNFIYKNDEKQIFDKYQDIFLYDINIVNSLLSEIIYNKNKKEYKININALIYSYQLVGYENNLLLINILSMFYSLLLYLFYAGINENKKINLMSLLNDIQNYIIFLILTSFIFEENILMQKSYEQVQQLLYKNIFFNILNLINHLNDKENKTKYLQILHNIILFLSVIYNIDKKESTKKKNSGFFSNLFSTKIDLSKTAPIYLIQFLMKNSEELFNDENFKYFINNKNENKDEAYNLINEKLNKELIDKTIFDLFDISIFEKIVKKRDSDLKFKLKLLITEEKGINIAINTYKKIFLKVKAFKNSFHYDETRKDRDDRFKIKKYRNIKKDLYSFNNSYSNLEVFYNINGNENKNKYLLKYKISNFLSKDMTRKFLKPIIDINYYLPNFRKYNYKSNEIYQHSNNQVYSIDLQIFDSINNIPLSPNINKLFDKHNYYIEENVCYVKTMNHIKGKIFHLINKDNLYLYFCIGKLPSEEELIKNYEDYDTINKSCFSSLFRNNLNKKDFDIYLNIKFSEIEFIFNRKYCFLDNSLEIFTSNHRSYYFKFKNTERRNKFLEHLIRILNKDSSIFKKLYKPINGIDEYNKKRLYGYYKDAENNSEYSNISYIKELWKNNKISNLEYLMWINIYGNRSYRDISQFPVFPWIIDDYKTNSFEEIINNDCIRNFKVPMGMMILDEKGKERAEGYLNSYKMMTLELIDENIVNFKIKEEDEEEIEEENNDIQQKSKAVADKPIKNEINEESNINTNKNSENENTPPPPESKNKKNKNSLKIPKYNYNIDKLYTNLNVLYEQIPYCYGSHYSNGMYVSHFLGRLFPYSLTMIEIQGTGFDCSERLFLCLDKTFLSSTNEKCDVRELIPEFYTLPEMFMNLNKLNFGEVNSTNFSDSVNYMNEIIEKNGGKTKMNVEDVLLPNWSKYNPYFFVQKKRELLESRNIDFNPWIDFIFGCSQRGIKAQEIGNLFLPYAYDGVMSVRLKEKNILEDRESTEYLYRLFELGVNPTKVFEKKNYETKIVANQITKIKNVEKPIPYIGGFEEKIRTIANIGNNYNSLTLYTKTHKVKKFVFDDRLETNEAYPMKEVVSPKDLSGIFNQDIASKLILRNLFKSNIILIAGFYSGNLYVINLENNSKLNRANSNLISKVSQEDQVLLQNYGKGIITSLEISKDEKYIIYGNNKGTLAIIENLYSIYLENNENKKFLKILKIISSHSGHIINSLFISSDLNIFADCSYDNFIHIYSLPKCDKINSFYINDINFNPDYIFLSAQPLPSILLYSNKVYRFKCYNINNHELKVEQNDKEFYSQLRINNCNEPMISPIVFTDFSFIDYLLYSFGYQFIILRKMPLMNIIFKINFDGDEFISLVNISLCKECIYVVDNNNKRIHIIKYKKNVKQISFSTTSSNNNNK